MPYVYAKTWNDAPGGDIGYTLNYHMFVISVFSSTIALFSYKIMFVSLPKPQ